MSVKPVMTLDCVGLYCPQPLLQTREAMDKIRVGEVLEVLADDPAAEPDLKRFAKRTGHTIVSCDWLENGVVRLLIRREK